MRERVNPTNPYLSPQVQSEVPRPAAPKRRSRLLWLVLPTMVGVVLGSIFLDIRGPGGSISGSCGGFLGLAFGMLLRLLSPLWEHPLPKEEA